MSTSDADNHVIEIDVGNTPLDSGAQTPKKTSNIEFGSRGAAGDEITYTIEYYNNNGEPVDVVITDTLDTGLDFVSASDEGTYDAKTRTVIRTIADAESEYGSVTLTAKVNQTAVGDGRSRTRLLSRSAMPMRRNPTRWGLRLRPAARQAMAATACPRRPIPTIWPCG